MCLWPKVLGFLGNYGIQGHFPRIMIKVECRESLSATGEWNTRGVATCTHGRTCVLKKSKNAAKKKEVIIE